MSNTRPQRAVTWPRRCPTDPSAAFELYEQLGLTPAELPIGDPSTDEEIDAEEARGERIPAVVRELWKMHDGVGPGLGKGSADLPIAGRTDRWRAAGQLSSILAEHLSSEEHAGPVRTSRDVRRLLPEENLFAIGTSASGDAYFLDLRGRTRSGIPVLLLKHDALFEYEEVAPSLGALVAKLAIEAWEEREGEPSPLSVPWERITRKDANRAAAYPKRRPPKKKAPIRAPRARISLELTGWLGDRAFRHESHLRAIAYAPDGRHVISGRPPGELFLWEIATGKLARSLDVDMEPRRLVFAAKGRRLLVAGIHDGDDDEGRLTLLDVATGRALWSREPGRIVSVTLSRDEKTVYVLQKQVVQLFDLASGKKGARITGLPGEAEALAVSPDGARLAVCGDEYRVRLFDARTRKPEGDVAFPEIEYPKGLAFTTRGDRLLLATAESVSLLDLASSQWIERRRGLGTVDELVTNPAGTHALARGDERSEIVDLATGKRVRTETLPEKVYYSALSHDARTIAYGRLDDLSSLAFTTKTKERLPRLVDAAFTSKGAALALGTDRLLAWDLARGRVARTIALPPGTEARSFDVSRDGRRAVVVTFKSQLHSIDLVKGRIEGALRWPGSGRTNLYEVALNDDGSRALVGGVTDLALYDLARGRSLGKLAYHEGEWILDAAISPDGKRGLSADSHHAVLWDLDARKPITDRLGRGNARAAAFSPDGRHAVVGGIECPLRLVATSDPSREVWSRTDHDLDQLAFTPDGRWIVGCASETDGALHVLDAATGRTVSQPFTLASESDQIASFVVGAHRGRTTILAVTGRGAVAVIGARGDA